MLSHLPVLWQANRKQLKLSSLALVETTVCFVYVEDKLFSLVLEVVVCTTRYTGHKPILCM